MDENKRKYPDFHLSLRVPWHDNEWKGTFCKEPRFNNACLILDRVADTRDDDHEDSLAGKTIEKLDEDKWPACTEERGMFMAPFEYSKIVEHPYMKSSQKTHGHFKPTLFQNPAFTASAIPFKWMLKKNFDHYKKVYDLDIDMEIEPELPFHNNWVQAKENQEKLLNCFLSHVKPEKSLCFFYAKKVPFVEEYGRVIIGVGRVNKMEKPKEYEYSEEKDLKGMIWETPIHHSIRPDFEDGFLLPYHQAITHLEKYPDTDLNLDDLAVFAPEGKVEEFSYVAEHVSNDSAIEVLVGCAESLKKAKKYLKGPWDECLRWIDERLGEIWKMRGPSPGLGSALVTLGLRLGNFIAMELSESVGENEDPWEIIDDVFKDPKNYLSPYLAEQIDGTMQRVWEKLTPEKKELLRLLSRFEINSKQAKMIYDQDSHAKYNLKFDNQDIIENPYLIFELTRHTPNPVSFLSVDHGIFPDPFIRNKHPLPDPSRVSSELDWRRLRALIVDVLEKATYEGHTLLPLKAVISKVEERKMDPPCDLNQDILTAVEDDFDGTIELVEMNDGSRAYQLQHLYEMGKIIRTSVLKRTKGIKNSVDFDPKKAINDYFNKKDAVEGSEEAEMKARKEKEYALRQITESRFSVLIGSAGTGKTTLLSILCSQKSIKDGKVLLLAPTGKARVMMEKEMKHLDLRGFTIAQFLNSSGRFDGETQRFRLMDLTEKPPSYMGDTVIIDEASMLTEEMLAAVLNGLTGYKRLILVGDPYQLPPIGPGRPFMDIISTLKPDNFDDHSVNVAPSYAELTINRRQIRAKEERKDINLARWFRGDSITPGEDDINDVLKNLESSKYLKFIKWEDENEFQEKMMQVLVDELKLKNDTDYKNFNLSIGAFDSGYPFRVGSASRAEEWQVLSPVRNWKHGVIEINRLLHQKFKGKFCNQCKRDRNKPSPMGIEGIVWGDKVINLLNRRDKKYKLYDGRKDGYMANGEIGLAVGTYQDWALNVEFASQPGYTYQFTKKHFGGEDEPPSMELAYALTVHKAQGSEFGKVILVIPNPCPLLSRELLYTALTRQKEGVIVLTQGDPFELRKYSKDEYSETKIRFTNLFRPPKPRKIGNKFLEENLIHTTSIGVPVRSKSEVIIADRLTSNGITYHYEEDLEFKSVVRSPDFTIHDDSGVTYYWEHLGMLQDEEYKEKWEKKLKWYKQNGIFPIGEEKEEYPNKVLIISKDDDRGGISSQEIDKMIEKILMT